MEKIVFLTGAGCSTESGIPTYRDDHGIWKKYNPAEVCSIAGFKANPEKSIQFHNEARLSMLNCEPNDAHKLIAQLEEKYLVTVITQNVDNLHEKAGSTNILHFHGEIFKNKLPHGETKYSEEPIAYYEDEPAELQIRPDIVMFGEDVYHWSTSQDIVEEADIVVIVGTSLQVWPFSDLIKCAKYSAKKYVIDPVKVTKDPDIEHIQKPASSGMQILFDKLMK